MGVCEQVDIQEDYAETLAKSAEGKSRGKLLDMCYGRLTPIEGTQDGQHENKWSEHIFNRFMRSD